MDWFLTLSITEQILWVISIIATIVFFVQMILLAVRKKLKSPKDYIFSELFSFRSITAFMSVFGWMSIAALNQGIHLIFSIVFGIFSGILMMFVMNLLIRITQNIKATGQPVSNKDLQNTGEVISYIGGERSNIGKIKIKINGKYKIMNAMTDFKDGIQLGTKVKVESVSESGVLIISPS